MLKTKSLLAILFCLFLNSAYSQQYLNESCVWSIKDLAYVDFLSFNANYEDYLQGDTLIESHSYFKVYRSGIVISGFTPDDSTYINEINEYKGALREEDKEWYWIPKDSSNAELLHDFNKVEGDSVEYNNGIKHKLVLTDSIYHGGEYRKVYHLEGSVFINLIEGVGWNTKLIDPLFNLESFPYLQCYRKDDESIQPDLTIIEEAFNLELEELDDCEIISNVETQTSAHANIQIYPNPFKHRIVINSKIKIDEITFLNALGRKVRVEKLTQDEIELDGLEAGIYYLVLKGGDKVYTRKLVKIKER